LKRLLRRKGESISDEQHLFSSVFCPNILGCGFVANKQLTEPQMKKKISTATKHTTVSQYEGWSLTNTSFLGHR